METCFGKITFRTSTNSRKVMTPITSATTTSFPPYAYPLPHRVRHPFLTNQVKPPTRSMKILRFVGYQSNQCRVTSLSAKIKGRAPPPARAPPLSCLLSRALSHVSVLYSIPLDPPPSSHVFARLHNFTAAQKLEVRGLNSFFVTSDAALELGQSVVLTALIASNHDTASS